jgi:predicted CoA-binding protein
MDEACPLPTPASHDEESEIQAMLQMKRIAIVGLSDDPSRASFEIASYLLSHSKDVVPVNPMLSTVLGLKSYPTLADIPGEIDLVNVFRRSEFCEQVTKEAISRGVKGVWLQAGIRNDEAREWARRAGIHYVENRCILVEHSRHRA